LHKGMQFAVGKLHFKVQNIEGASADNLKIKAKLDAEKAERDAEKKDEKKPDVELDDDEEFADDSDDEDTKKPGKTGKLDGPPVMFLASVDKKLGIKGRIRETSTIGFDKEKNKISCSPEVAKARAVDAVHTKICLEDGRFFLENESRGFGTYVGLPKKRFFEVNAFDSLLIGSARAGIFYKPVTFQVVNGLIDKILGDMGTQSYDMKIVGNASIETRLKAARKDED